MLVRLLGDIDIAEEAVQDAFVAALAYDAALVRTENVAERAFLQRRRAPLTPIREDQSGLESP